MKIYVGNMSLSISEEELKKAFEAFGKVDTINIIKDKVTGQPRGFGFVEMSDNNEGQAAITGLNGKDMGGKPLKVNEAKAKS